MIKVSVMYPDGPGITFDMDYYRMQHMSLVGELLGGACIKKAVESGISVSDIPMTYIAMGHLYFDSVEAYQTAFDPHAEQLMADIPNYTNASPVIQVSEVIIP